MLDIEIPYGEEDPEIGMPRHATIVTTVTVQRISHARISAEAVW